MPKDVWETKKPSKSYTPKVASKPSSPSGYFGSMYTAPRVIQSPSQAVEDRKRAYASMAGVGIKSLSGATTGDKAGERAREIQRGNIGGGAKFKPIADYDKGLFTIGAGDTPPDDITPDKKGLEHIIADAFFGKPLNQLDELELKKAQQMLSQFRELGINNPLKLRSLMTSNIAGGIFGKDQTYSDLDGNIVDPANIIDKGDGRLMALVDGEYVDVRRTREGAIDQMKETFGDDIIKRLKMHNPEIYYPSLGGYLPGSTGELETLGKEATLKKNQDGKYITADGRIIPKEQAEKYNKMIFEARNLSDPKTRYTGLGSYMGEGGGGGGGGIPLPDPTPDPDDPMIPVDPVPYPGIPTTPTIPTIPKYPSSVITDYTQLGLPNIYGNQQMPTYGYANFNQTGQPVGLKDYLENLRQRFGIG